MSLDERLTALANELSADVKSILLKLGNLATLNTASKTNLVSAINELQAALGGAGGDVILDSAGAGDTAHTWSADRIVSGLADLKSSILGDVDAAHDTLAELVADLQGADTALNGLLTAVGNRVRFDAAQSLTAPQQAQACANIGIGDPDVDLVAIYNAGKA